MDEQQTSWLRDKIAPKLFFVAICFVLSAVLMYLWNALLPQITHVSTINYWQALGLMLLSRILFGGFSLGWLGGGRFNKRPSDNLKDKLSIMDDTDRAAFKEEWRKRCEGWKKGE